MYLYGDICLANKLLSEICQECEKALNPIAQFCAEKKFTGTMLMCPEFLHRIHLNVLFIGVMCVEDEEKYGIAYRVEILEQVSKIKN
jgi:hypothetical protein